MGSSREPLPLDRWRALPKVELHVHLDGAFDPAILWEAVSADTVELPVNVPTPWDLGEHIVIRERVRQCASSQDYHALVSCRGRQSLHNMLRCFETFLPSVRGRMDLVERLAFAFCARQARSNVIYSEVRYSPHLLDVHGAMSGSDPAGTGPDGEALQIDPAAVIEAVTRGLRAGCAAHPGIVVNQILCCISFRPEWAESTVEHAHRRRVDVPCAVVGVDIAAGEDALDPATNPESFRLHSQAFARARSLGLNITLHAGEEGVSKNVQTALDVFGASRIGHGYAAARDTAQLEACISAGVHFEVCPTSSYATSGWLNGGSGNGNGPDWSTHPLRTFVERGLSVSISTDDPSVFDTTLEEEYALSEARVGLSAAQLVECTMCAARAAFVGEDERAALCETIAQAARRLQLI